MKQTVKKLLRYLGLFHFSAWINKNLLNILMYHGFSEQKNNTGLTNFDGKHLDVDEFEDHLKLIKKYCTPISLEEAILNKRLPPNPIILTFDDGYKNNYIYAYPLLRNYRVPVTIFLTTGFIDQSHYMWPDRVEFMINQTKIRYIDLLWEGDLLKLELDNDLFK